MSTLSSLHSAMLFTKPPMASTSAQSMAPAVNSTSNDSTTNSAAISANDFLTLLVTEMQNQDPTATTDPNEYINQLVQVNSLQQLIQINQSLSSSLSSSTTGATAQHVAGNLNIPDSTPAALTVAQALSGQDQAHPAVAGLLPAPTIHPQ